MTTASLENTAVARSLAAKSGRCIDCGRSLEGSALCPGCGRDYAEIDGILHAIGPLTGTNKVSANFFNSANWTKFKFWEGVFLFCQGPGQARARWKVLRHLPEIAVARVLEVGIGDGENLPLLPKGWEVYRRRPRNQPASELL